MAEHLSGRFVTSARAVLEGVSFGIVAVYYAGAMVPTLYRIPAFKFDGYRVYTNLPACGA